MVTLVQLRQPKNVGCSNPSAFAVIYEWLTHLARNPTLTTWMQILSQENITTNVVVCYVYKYTVELRLTADTPQQQTPTI